MSNKSASGLAAIICCHNSEKLIESSMLSLVTQEIGDGINYEIILVDNCSTDDTVTLARAVAARHNRELIVIREDQKGLIYARMAGVRSATQPICLFVDDDNILSRDYVARTVKIYRENEDVGAVGGYAEPYIINRNVPEWFPEYQLMFACGPQAESTGKLMGIKQYLYGAGLSFRTDVLRNILFDKMPPLLTGRTGDVLLRGDDTEMCFRCFLIGWKLFYDDTLRLRHNIDAGRITWRNACTMRRKSGMAWIILNIYLRLALGQQPRSMSYMFALLCYRWLRFLGNPKNLVRMFITGSGASLGFHFLLGMTQSVIFWAQKYNVARKQIVLYFTPE